MGRVALKHPLLKEVALLLDRVESLEKRMVLVEKQLGKKFVYDRERNEWSVIDFKWEDEDGAV